MKIYVAGSLNMDLVIGCDVVPTAGQTLTGYGFMTNPGGKGANQAVAVGKNGGDVYMVGCVGKEFGSELIATLKGYDVNTEYVKQLNDVSSGIAVIVVCDGDNRIILDEGANGRLTVEDVEKALENAEAGDIFIAQLEVPVPVVERSLRIAKSKGMITILNPAPSKEISKETFAYVDYFMPNQTETEYYTGIYPSNMDTARTAVAKMRDTGVKNVIITMGKNGAGVFAEEEYVVPAFVVEAVDTTAAGDTFVGAFAARLSLGDSVKDAVTYANKASSITVTRKGAQQSIPTTDEVLK